MTQLLFSVAVSSPKKNPVHNHFAVSIKTDTNFNSIQLSFLNLFGDVKLSSTALSNVSEVAIALTTLNFSAEETLPFPLQAPIILIDTASGQFMDRQFWKLISPKFTYAVMIGDIHKTVSEFSICNQYIAPLYCIFIHKLTNNEISLANTTTGVAQAKLYR